jgi:hypothetical protein
VSLVFGSMVVVASAAQAGTGIRYQVVDADNARDGGVFYRNSPSWGDTSRTTGKGGYYGETVELVCGAWGDAVGPYATRRWHLVDNLSRPAAGRGWLPDRYLNTPNKANQATPGEPECGAAPPAQTQPIQPAGGARINQQSSGSTPNAVPLCVYNMRWAKKNLTFSYTGTQRYHGNAWQAAKNWTDAGTGITMRPAPAGQTGDIIFYDVDIPTQPKYYAEALVPVGASGKALRSIAPVLLRPDHIWVKVNKTAMNNLTGLRQDVCAHARAGAHSRPAAHEPPQLQDHVVHDDHAGGRRLH